MSECGQRLERGHGKRADCGDGRVLCLGRVATKHVLLAVATTLQVNALKRQLEKLHLGNTVAQTASKPLKNAGLDFPLFVLGGHRRTAGVDGTFDRVGKLLSEKSGSMHEEAMQRR